MDTVEDNKQRLQNLINFSQRRREWYQEIYIKIADRQSDQISLITSISAAILAITSAFSTERTFWIELSFWTLMMTVVFGVILLLLLTVFDRSAVTDDREMELASIDALKESTKRAIDEYPEYQTVHIADFKDEMEKIMNAPFKNEWKKKILSFLYYLVLVFFLLGVTGLAFSWIEKGGVSVNMNLFVLSLILIASTGLGFIKFGTLKQPKDENWNWQQKFAEIWNCSVNFFVAGLVAYYFLAVRWPYIVNGDKLVVADFILLLVFGMGMFGHLNVLSINLTNGVEAILKRVLERK